MSPRNATVAVGDRKLNLPVRAIEAEDGTVSAFAFTDAYELLNAWKDAAPTQRNFGWTGDENDLEPETVLVFWIDSRGNLATEYISPVYDGAGVHNAYPAEEFDALIDVTVELQ